MSDVKDRESFRKSGSHAVGLPTNYASSLLGIEFSCIRLIENTLELNQGLLHLEELPKNELKNIYSKLFEF
jgi:hypothetical protein